MRWLEHLVTRIVSGKAHRLEEVERRTERATQEAERVKKMVEHYRQAQDALRR